MMSTELGYCFLDYLYAVALIKLPVLTRIFVGRVENWFLEKLITHVDVESLFSERLSINKSLCISSSQDRSASFQEIPFENKHLL